MLKFVWTDGGRRFWSKLSDTVRMFLIKILPGETNTPLKSCMSETVSAYRSKFPTTHTHNTHTVCLAMFVLVVS